MGLAEFQRLLGRLYTDPALRARFEADRRAVAREFGLDDDDSAGVVGLSVGQIGRFAEALVAKRRNEVEKLLPWTRGALGPARFTALFRRHAAGYVPAGPKKHRHDALEFANLLARETGAGPDWLTDLVRLEAALLVAGGAPRRLVARRFRYAPDDLARIGELGSDATAAPPPCPTLCLWFRASRRGRVRLLRLSTPRGRWFRPSLAGARPGRA
jgi:hypothetical protein